MPSKYVKIDGKEQAAVVFELTAYVVMPKNGKSYKTYIQTDEIDIGQIQIAKNIESIVTLSGAKSIKAKTAKAKTAKAKPIRKHRIKRPAIGINIWDDYDDSDTKKCKTYAFVEIGDFSLEEKLNILENFELRLFKNYGFGDTKRVNRKIIPANGVSMKLNKKELRLEFTGLTHKKREALVHAIAQKSMRINNRKVQVYSES